MKLAHFLVAAYVLFAPFSRAEDPCSGPLITPGSKTLLIGDSLGVGLGPQFKKLAKAAGYVPTVHAVGGSTTLQWLSWIKRDLKVHKPSLVIVSLGTNDSALHIEEIRKNSSVYAHLVSEIEAIGAMTVWIGPPKLHRRLSHADEVRDIIKNAIESPYYESQKLDFPQTADMIHSTQRGYEIWMSSAWEWMVQQGVVNE